MYLVWLGVLTTKSLRNELNKDIMSIVASLLSSTLIGLGTGKELSKTRVKQHMGLLYKSTVMTYLVNKM